MNIYYELTNRFNPGRLRVILSSGQAVVLHRLAMMSKDGDWMATNILPFTLPTWDIYE